jgi:molybdopterin converting factor small subunit
MIKVKFFGALRLDLGTASVEVEASTVQEVYEKLAEMFAMLKAKDLKNYVTFVNGENIVNLKMQSTELNSGDEIILMSPVSGG